METFLLRFLFVARMPPVSVFHVFSFSIVSLVSNQPTQSLKQNKMDEQNLTASSGNGRWVPIWIVAWWIAENTCAWIQLCSAAAKQTFRECTCLQSFSNYFSHALSQIGLSKSSATPNSGRFEWVVLMKKSHDFNLMKYWLFRWLTPFGMSETRESNFVELRTEIRKFSPVHLGRPGKIQNWLFTLEFRAKKRRTWISCSRNHDVCCLGPGLLFFFKITGNGYRKKTRVKCLRGLLLS